MRNIIILGSGRSGTSLMAGCLAKAGYFMGDCPIPSRQCNPKGIFEDREVNDINEEILAPVVPKRPPLLGKWFFRDRPLQRQRWLARVNTETRIRLSQHLTDRIKNIVKREPFCLKDPRFSYTLSAWRPFLKNTVFICVFRSPSYTIQSILKESMDDAGLHSLYIDTPIASEIWYLMYKHILEIHRHEGEWLFLHYDQIMRGKKIDTLENFTGARIDRSFPDVSLVRRYNDRPVSEKVFKTYQELCDLAGYVYKK